MSAMVQIFSWGERWNVPFNEAKPSWMGISSFTEWKYLFHCTNEKQKTKNKQNKKQKQKNKNKKKNTFIICFI